MRLLLLPAYFYPEVISSSHLDTDLYSALLEDGNDLVAYTPIPSRGISKETRKRYSHKRYETRYDAKFIIHRFPLMSEPKNSVLRALRYSICVIKQFNRAILSKDARRCDLFYSASTPPIKGFVIAIAKQIVKKPFVYNLQDIFPDSLVGTGLAKQHGFLWKLGRVIEDYTYRHSDKIIVISEDFKKNIIAKGVPEEKISVVYNWVDDNAVRPVKKEDNPLFEEFGIDRGMFTVVYAGNLGNAQNISIILDTARLVSDIQFVLFGTGGAENDIRLRIEKERLTNVHLHPLQPIERVSQVYSVGDACIVSCKAGLGGSAMPSKTWNIMSCGRPVIANFDEGELKDILEKNDCGLFSHAGNVQEFVSAIKMLATNPVRCVEMGKNARHFIEENLTKEVGTKKYVDIIKSFEKK